MKPKASEQPRTLGAAKELIRDLQLRMGLLKTSDHVPAPTPPPREKTIPTQMPIPIPSPAPGINLANLTPKGLREFFETSTTTQLRALLAAETGKSHKLQNPMVTGALYRELKNRRQ